MKNDFLIVITQLSAEKNLSRDVVFEAVEAALASAYKKDNQSTGNVVVKINPTTGDVQAFNQRLIVEEVTDPKAEIGLPEARKHRPDAALGETVDFEMPAQNSGRIAAQTAKQVVLQKLREAEREVVFEEYADKEGDILSGVVQRVEPKQVIVDVGPPSVPCDLPEEPVEPGLNWDFWLGPAPQRPYNSVLSPRGVHTHFPNWRNYREYSGGMMTDWGAHHFDIAQWGLGMDDSGPVEIIPPEDPKATRGVRYLYANGVEMIHGDSGGILFIGTDGKILVNRGKFEATPKALGEEPLDDKAVRLYKSNNHAKDFLDCVRNRKKPICDVEIGCRSVTVCHLGNLAYWNHRHLKWDPAKERFIGDDVANQWLDRPKREPWKV